MEEEDGGIEEEEDDDDDDVEELIAQEMECSDRGWCDYYPNLKPFSTHNHSSGLFLHFLFCQNRTKKTMNTKVLAE